jgi:predicted nucleic acid-binding protein
MKKVFLDTDILLDLILQREKFFQSPAIVFEMAARKELSLHVSSLSFSNLFYILRKSYSSSQSINILKKLSAELRILSVNSGVVMKALDSSFKDFEDAIQYFSALNNGMDVILTRNIKDYKLAEIPVVTADEFIRTV